MTDATYDDDVADDFDADDIDSPNRVVAAGSKRVLDYIVRQIVEDPESVVVDVEERGRSVTLRLHVAPDDLGRVIGRRGRVAQAIRTVVRAAGAREGIDASVDIVD